MHSGIVILDFGSQFTQLIARRLREENVFSQIFPYSEPLENIEKLKPKGIIISGGPFSVSDSEAPKRDVLELINRWPVLGVCYGMQLITEQLGGRVKKADKREYGLADVDWFKSLSSNVPKKQSVWMSHGDIIEEIPKGFELLAESHQGHPAAIKSDSHQVWALQFHPEVSHTDHGVDIIKAFAMELCGAKPDWTAQNILDEMFKTIKEQVPEGESVLCALSGGVDSTVTGTLLTQALGAKRVHCVFVDNGLLRKNEFEEVIEIYKTLGLNVQGVRAEEEFLKNLSGKSDPEEKRKIIGHTFIDVFKKSISEIETDLGGKIKWLAQGTLYPDVIESVSVYGKSETIKSHHNVGGLPKDLQLQLVEPLRELFKDEVRAVGASLGIPRDILWRHPFPGPGLGIRVLGAITKECLETLREADAIYIEELKKQGLYDQIWQAFSVLLPVRTVGVQGDGRTYRQVLGLRAVTSKDGMTADWFNFPTSFLRQVSNRITNEVHGVNRVVYDITSKPPGTIEWE